MCHYLYTLEQNIMKQRHRRHITRHLCYSTKYTIVRRYTSKIQTIHNSTQYIRKCTEVLTVKHEFL